MIKRRTEYIIDRGNILGSKITLTFDSIFFIVFFFALTLLLIFDRKINQCHNKTLALLVQVFNIQQKVDLRLVIYHDKYFIGIFKDIGITESEKVVEVQRSDLVAEHIGGTAGKTTKIIKKADRGVLFVDEAYTLCSPSERDFWKEAAQALMAYMNNNVNPNIKNPITIFAGYKEQMNDFLKMNPGLTRRVKTVLNFADFTPDNLCDITKCKILQQSVRVPLGIYIYIFLI